MQNLSRRTFLKSATALGALSLGLGRRSAWSQPGGSNEAIRIAVIGLGRKGSNHLQNVLTTPGVRLAALCDVDPVVLARAREALPSSASGVFLTTDARQVLERKDVDALLIATTDHWHALLTVWACQAGKDVYVEKPLSQTVREGRRMVEAARKYGRIVQHGTQARSDIANPEVVAYLREGNLGAIQFVHAVFLKPRDDIGHPLPWYPDWLDYDLYCGPAPVRPLVRRELHYDWHWFWDTGNGDATNIGVHVFDLARWMAGHSEQPRRILSLGGRFAIGDSAETPNTLLTVFDYADIPVFHEIRGLPASPGDETMDHVRGLRSGVMVQCEHGYFAGRNGGWVYDNAGKRIRGFPGDGGAGHLSNFLGAVRSRREGELAASIQTGYTSTTPCILSTLSQRVGRPAMPDSIRAELASFPYAAGRLDSIEKHLGRHGVDLRSNPLTLGRWLEVSPLDGTIEAVGGGDDGDAALVHHLFDGISRPGYELPDLT
ncbi:MAG: Gfo/Idh/MocA family oxidoreductase [Opitutaceae bacterium]